MYLETQDICKKHGYPGYEVSNHARPGSESRHNLTYWRQGDWAAIGPGAHGRLTLPGTRVGTEALRAPEAWLGAVEQRGSGELSREVLARHDQAVEYLLMSMRLVEGMDMARFAALNGAPLDGAAVESLLDLALVQVDGGRIRATRTGRLVLNAILRELAP